MTTYFALVAVLSCYASAAAESHDTDTPILSPNYPNAFGQREERTYTVSIKRHDTEKYVVAFFDKFDIVADPKKPDAVSLKFEDHSGREIGTYTTDAPPGIVGVANRYGPTFTIRFRCHVDVPVNVTGFKISFKRLNDTEIEGNMTRSGKSQGHIHSPGYPWYYPIKSVYIYTISTPLEDGIVQFEFQDIDLGEGAVVGVYDADTDGTPYLIYSFYNQQGRSWRYYVSGNVMTLVLKTGTRPANRGFNLTYTEYCRIAGEELPCSLLPHSAMTNVIIFVVSITGIIGFIFLLVGCSVFFRKR